MGTTGPGRKIIVVPRVDPEPVTVPVKVPEPVKVPAGV